MVRIFGGRLAGRGSLAAYAVAAGLLAIAVFLARAMHVAPNACDTPGGPPVPAAFWVVLAAAVTASGGTVISAAGIRRRALGRTAVRTVVGLALVAASVVIGFAVVFVSTFCLPPL